MLGGTSTIVDPTAPLEEQWAWWILADVWAYDPSTEPLDPTAVPRTIRPS